MDHVYFHFLSTLGGSSVHVSKVAGMDVVRKNIYLSWFLKCKLGLKVFRDGTDSSVGSCLRKVLKCACSRLT